MTTADESIEQVRERAALYALGALPPDEARAVEQRLMAGDARYLAEVAAFRAVGDALAYAAPPQSPPPQARERVQARIAALQSAVIEQRGTRFVRGERLDWEPGWVAGLEIKRLQADESLERATVLCRLAPGALYPPHRHGGVEEIYLLEGDLLVNGVLMRAGDYCHAAADTVHEGIRTQGGCLFLVTASTRDELFV